MKRLYATDKTALELIRSGAMPRDYASVAFAPADMLDAASNARDIKQLVERSDTIARLTQPYMVLVPEHAHRRNSKLITCRALSASITEPYLVSIDEDCLCVTPELLFILYGQKHSFATSVQLGLELCGTYTLPAFSDNECFTTYDLPVLTTAKSIREFIARNPGIYGAKRAKRFARILRNGSASPMETVLFLLLCLPVSEGGYGLPLPEFNADLPVIQYLGSMHVPQIRYGDLVYRAARVVLEYQSSEHHAGVEKRESDEDRRDDIEATGYTVMFITPSRIKDFDRFEAVVQRLARYLGVDFSRCEPGRSASRLALRQLLLPESWTE